MEASPALEPLVALDEELGKLRGDLDDVLRARNVLARRYGSPLIEQAERVSTDDRAVIEALEEEHRETIEATEEEHARLVKERDDWTSRALEAEEAVGRMRGTIADAHRQRDDAIEHAKQAIRERNDLQGRFDDLQRELDQLTAPPEPEKPDAFRHVEKPPPREETVKDGRSQGLRGRQKQSDQLISAEQVRDFVVDEMGNHWFQAGVITSHFEVSNATASRRLNELLERGIIVKRGNMGSTKYKYAGKPEGTGPARRPEVTPLP